MGKYISNDTTKACTITKKAVRKVTCSKYLESTKEIFPLYKLLKLCDIFKYSIGIFAYKFENNKLPAIFDNFFVKKTFIHAHHTRKADDYGLIHCRLNTRQFSAKSSGAKIWNSIPSEIRNSKSLEIFKKKIKNHLLGSY